MKFLLTILFFISGSAIAQTFVVKSISENDQTDALQTAFNNSAINTVIINSGDLVINGTINIPEGKVLKFEGGNKLRGKGTVNGGIIDANYQTQIFDTALTVNPKAVNQYFSVKWFGAKGKNTDDYVPIQKTINTCIKNNIRTVFFPLGKYKISKPLILRGTLIKNKSNKLQSGFCTLELLGESSFWDSNSGSEIYPVFTNGFAIGIQRGKGCKIRKLRITGLFKPPNTNDPLKFYNTSFEKFTDGVCRDNRYSPYAAIVIDPFTNASKNAIDTADFYPGLTSFYGEINGPSVQSGSTGTEIEEMSINNFVVGICSSPNRLTRNAEITIINKIQFNNCKLCISGGQDQEKANVISNIYCWGGTHTIFATGLYGVPRMAGNWNIDHANIAGAVVRFIYNEQHGYFPTYISQVFAESLGSFGTLNSELASEVSDCIFDFAYQNIAGKQTLITAWGENVVFRSCNFRYYGEKTPLIIEGNAIFENCYFSGPIIKSKKLSAGNLYNFINSKNRLSNAGQIIAGIILVILFLLYYKRTRTHRLP